MTVCLSHYELELTVTFQRDYCYCYISAITLIVYMEVFKPQKKRPS